LLYIAATSEAVSMVLVTERPDPHALHELGSSSADGSGSLDPQPVVEPRAANGSRSQDPRPAEETEADEAAGFQSLEAAMGPPDQGITGSKDSELPPGTKGLELPGPAPMEMDVPDRPTSGVLHQ
jgi:hypothetical protein